MANKIDLGCTSSDTGGGRRVSERREVENARRIR